jgi:hypothetical protein
MTISSVANDGNVNDWKSLHQEILNKFIYIFPIYSPTADVSPASTARYTDDRLERMREIVYENLENLSSAPIAIQRLCEFLTTNESRDEEKFLFSILRIISSSHYVLKSRLPVRRSRTDSETYRTSSDESEKNFHRRGIRYSDSMITRRTLKRSRNDLYIIGI